MLNTLIKFINFSGEENKKMFINSIWLGVLSAICSALRVPATYVVLAALLDGTMTKTTIFLSLGILLASLAATIIINMKSTMLQTKAGYRTCANKRIEIAEHLRYLPMGWFNDNSLGEVTSVTTNTLESMANVATRVVMVTTKGFLTAGTVTIMMLIFDWRIGLVAVGGLIVFFGVNALMQKNVGKISQRKVNADENLVVRVLEYVQGITEVKSFDLTTDVMKQTNDAIEEAKNASIDAELPMVLFGILQFIVNKLTGIAICIASLVFYLNGALDLASCVMMIICSFMLFEQLDSAGGYSSLLRTIEIGTNKVQAVLDEEPMDINGKEMKPVNEEITLNHVDFSYGKKKIIDDVSLTIPPKTTVAVVGPSGSGKTTLCHLMARFWDVQEGSVCLGGEDVRNYSFDSLIANYSFVFQSTYLFSDTIANNIHFGKPDATMDEVVEAAKKARCHDFIMALPDGYDTVIGEGGSTISGGERQRIAIARAILKDAAIIILDEATAYVDPVNEKELMEAIEELTLEKSVIMIAHRLKTVRNADCIYVLDNGKIVQQGTHEELINEEGIYKRFVQQRKQAVSWRI